MRLTEVIMYQPVDDIALNFFMANYVGNDINSQFEYMPTLYSRFGFLHADFQDGIKAIGMAGYAKEARRPELMQAAKKKYGSALRNVNLSLSSPELAKQDTTLVSVLLLAMFEIMSLPRSQGLKNLSAHLNGALLLATTRIGNKEHLDFTMKLLKSICQAVSMNCWVQNTPLPDGLLRVIGHLKRVARTSDLHPQYLHLTASLIDFRHTPDSCPQAAIQKAIALNALMEEFANGMPQEVHFISHFGHPDRIRAYGGRYHTYKRSFTALFWNNLRSSRIWLHEIIIARCRTLLASPKDDGNTETRDFAQRRLNISIQEIRTIAHDICCTVPQVAGYITDLNNAASCFERQSSSGHEHTKVHPAPTISQGDPLTQEPSIQRTARTASQYHLLNQLRELDSCPHLDPDMQAWIAARIAWIESLAGPSDLNLLSARARATTPSGSFPFFMNRYVLPIMFCNNADGIV